MYDQTRLEILPSWRLSAIVAAPFLASIYLATLIEIDSRAIYALVIVLLVVGYGFVQNLCFLRSADSIRLIDVSEGQISAIDKSGQLTKYKLNSAIINRLLCFVSIDLDPPISDNWYSKLFKNQRYVLITSLNTNDVNNVRRLRALISLCANKL